MQALAESLFADCTGVPGGSGPPLLGDGKQEAPHSWMLGPDALLTLGLATLELATSGCSGASTASRLRPGRVRPLPKVHRDESRTHGLDRLELIRFLQVSQAITVHHGALAFLLGINALRASEAAAVRIGDYADTMRGHRVLHLVGKGNKPATMPITVPVLRVLEACRGHRTMGPLILRPLSGNPIDRRDAYRMVARIAKTASIPRHISPHSLRHAAITNALDAGVPLRDAQIPARHAEPRTTEHYDRARGNLDRHGLHFSPPTWQVSSHPAASQWASARPSLACQWTVCEPGYGRRLVLGANSCSNRSTTRGRSAAIRS